MSGTGNMRLPWPYSLIVISLGWLQAMSFSPFNTPHKERPSVSLSHRETERQID